MGVISKLEDYPKFLATDNLDLDSVFSVGKDFLCFYTTDTPYEERLVVKLWNDSQKIIDELELASDYTPGIFKALNVIERGVNFEFWPKVKARIIVLAMPKVILNTPANVKYTKLFSKHFLRVEILT